MRIFLNRDVAFRKVPVLMAGEPDTCIYNKKTGLFFWGDESDVRFLRAFQNGADISKISTHRDMQHQLVNIVPNLINDRFLLLESETGKEEQKKAYLKFFPVRTLFTVYYEHENEKTIDAALHRVGKNNEADFEILTLKNDEMLLYTLCGGEKDIEEIIRTLRPKLTADDVLSIFEKWTSAETQIIRLLPQPLSRYKEIPPPVFFPAPLFPKLKEAKESKNKLSKSVKDYHLKDISGGYCQFERIESTLSHIYRVRHPILGGKSYGEAFFSKLNEIKQIEQGFRIVEVGGGYGAMSKDVLLSLKRAKPEIFQSVKYTICDLSPALISSQRTLHLNEGVKAEYVHCDGEALPLKDRSADVIISNEVIADFSNPEFTLNQIDSLSEKTGIPITAEFVDSIKNTLGNEKSFRLNLGAFKLLKEIRRILKPGGIAIITEYGYENILPFRVKHLDHAEYTINFAHLQQVAESLGMQAELTNAFDFLNFREDVELITHSSFQAAFRLLEHNNIHLPNLVYTKELLSEQLGREAERLKNLQFVKASREPIEIVKVLICRMK